MDDQDKKLFDKLHSLLRNISSGYITEKRRARLQTELDEVNNIILDLNNRQTQLHSKLDAMEKSLSFFDKLE